MQACSQGIIVSKDQLYYNCFKGNIRSITPCFDALSYLYEYLLELLDLSRSIWFSLNPYAFIILRVHSLGTSVVSPLLRLRGFMVSHHFHANMKVQTAMCKDNNNSKSRTATDVKFDIYMILVDYIQFVKYSIFNIMVEFQCIKFHQS